MNAPRRKALSDLHRELGTILKSARLGAGRSTRELGYSSGHISNVEAGFVAPSDELAEVYIALGADRGAVMQLVDAIHHRSRSVRQSHRRADRGAAGSADAPPQRVGAGVSADDVRRHYIVERYELIFEFTPKGAIASVLSEAHIRAIHPNVRYYFTGVNADSSNRPGRLRVRSLSAAQIDYVHESPSGASDVFFRLDRGLRPDDPEPYRVAYLVEVSDDELADPQIMYSTRPGIREHSLEVRFRPPALPSRIWSFGVPDPYAADRPESGTLFEPSGDGVYRADFERIIPGWCYGLTWVWPDDLRSAETS